MFLSRQNIQSRLSLSRAALTSLARRRALSSIYDQYTFSPPPQSDEPMVKMKRRKRLHHFGPFLEEAAAEPRRRSELPFDFRFSYTDSRRDVVPDKFSPFGPGRVDRDWTGVCAPAAEGGGEDERRRRLREKIQGEELTSVERSVLINSFSHFNTRRQINLGKDGLTHNMLLEIQCHWKHFKAVRIKCQGVPTVDMINVCTQLEDKTFGKVIYKRNGILILYRGREYDPEKIPEVPLMLWKPQNPIDPQLLETTIEGLSIEETEQMRKRGSALPVLTKLLKNAYYGNLITMVRNAFLVTDLLRIDCTDLQSKDYVRIGIQLRDSVPCILMFDKDHIVIWRGKDYMPQNSAYFLQDSNAENRAVVSRKIRVHDYEVTIPW